MGGDDHIGHRDEPHQFIVPDDMAGIVLVEEVSFFLIHVQTGSTNLLVLDAGDQVLSVDQGTPGGVEDGHALFHAGNGVRIDQVLGFFRQRAVEGDNVGLFKKLRQVYVG